MEGSSHDIRFSAVVRVGFLQRALREISFGIEAPAGSPTLVRASRLRRLGETKLLRSDEAFVLHPDIVGITFQYMTRDADGNAVWLDDWNARPELPIAVRFQIELVAMGNQIRVSRMVGMLQ
jgi:general secretion pathway protein J